MKLDARYEAILDEVVREYIETAIPVSSGRISELANINLSASTIRNIMLELDDAGYLIQPYTSAGRIPTEKGYQYFIKNLSEMHAPSERAQREVTSATSRLGDDIDIAFNELSKVLARHLKLFSGIEILTKDRKIFSYGIADLLREPEFREHDLAVQFANIVDHLENELDRVSTQSDSPNINIGTFGIVSTVFCNKDIGECVLFSMGPRRMNYEAARSLLKYTADDIIGQTINT